MRRKQWELQSRHKEQPSPLIELIERIPADIFDAYNLPAVDFQPFELEYFQSQFERTVEYNLADSSVKCASVADLLTGEDQAYITAALHDSPPVRAAMVVSVTNDL